VYAIMHLLEPTMRIKSTEYVSEFIVSTSV
jgi:hypothetical protein